MLKMHITIDSYVLLRPVDVYVLMPYNILSQYGQHKVIWALHASISGASIFFDQLCVSSYVDKENCVIIAPNLGNGYFINSRVEQQADFLQDELFPVLQDVLTLSKNREDNLLLGISAGAYGSVNWVKNVSQNFFKVALISGCYSYLGGASSNLKKCREQYAIYQLTCKKILPILAETHAFPTDNNMTQILPTPEEVNNWPNLIMFCGEEDYLCKESTQKFYDYCKDMGLDINLNMSSGGHDNAYWSKVFPQAIKWLLAK